MNIKYTYILLISCVFLCSGVSAYAQQKGSQLKLKTVVIDPGHGGKDAGCVSKDRKTYEKNLTLSISKLFGQKIKEAYPDVKVIYTRTTDKYVTLNERADIANRNKADLFVSIHINSVKFFVLNENVHNFPLYKPPFEIYRRLESACPTFPPVPGNPVY